MKEKLFNILKKATPAQDKLKHYYFFSLFFIVLSIKLTNLEALFTTFLVALFWEIYQRKTGGTNSNTQMFWDVFFGVLLGVLITVSSLF